VQKDKTSVVSAPPSDLLSTFFASMRPPQSHEFLDAARLMASIRVMLVRAGTRFVPVAVRQR
jgi:hypothetical protein